MGSIWRAEGLRCRSFNPAPNRYSERSASLRVAAGLTILERTMQEPEERPGLPLWLPEPYHGPTPPGALPPVRHKRVSRDATGRKPSPREVRLVLTAFRVGSVILGIMIVAAIIVLVVLLAEKR